VEYIIGSYTENCITTEPSDEQKSKNQSMYADFESQVKSFHFALIEDKKYISDSYKFLTKNIWDEYYGQKCDFGFSFLNSILNCVHSYDETNSENKLVFGS